MKKIMCAPQNVDGRKKEKLSFILTIRSISANTVIICQCLREPPAVFIFIILVLTLMNETIEKFALTCVESQKHQGSKEGRTAQVRSLSPV